MFPDGNLSWRPEAAYVLIPSEPEGMSRLQWPQTPGALRVAAAWARLRCSASSTMTRHRLDRRALHPGPRRSQRDPRDFHHGLLAHGIRPLQIVSTVGDREAGAIGADGQSDPVAGTPLLRPEIGDQLRRGIFLCFGFEIQVNLKKVL